MSSDHPNRPWVFAGGLSFIFLQIAKIAYTVISKNIPFTLNAFINSLGTIISVGLLGLLVGYLFARWRGLFGSMNIYLQGVITFVVFRAAAGMATQGVRWLSTDEVISGSIIAAGAGLAFAYLGKKFGEEW